MWDATFEKTLREHLSLLPATTELAPDMQLGSLGLDSLASIQLLVSIEETYDVAIPDEFLNLETFSTPASLWRAVAALRSRNGGTGSSPSGALGEHDG